MRGLCEVDSATRHVETRRSMNNYHVFQKLWKIQCTGVGPVKDRKEKALEDWFRYLNQ